MARSAGDARSGSNERSGRVMTRRMPSSDARPDPIARPAWAASLSCWRCRRRRVRRRWASWSITARLRVCADPNNLPFSNDRGEGFENEIAELVAERLGVPVRYTWHPETMGFVRNTLRAYLCDVVMGVASGNELVQNTNPYYRSTYVLALSHRRWRAFRRPRPARP